MTVPIRRALPALLVLFVLFASQAAYAAQAQDRPNGHCAGSAPAEKGEKSCPLPLWLTCCDDQAAVGTAAGAPDAAGLLVLPAGSELASLALALWPALARPAEIPPDTTLRRSVVLLI